jgi:hypothetical protein
MQPFLNGFRWSVLAIIGVVSPGCTSRDDLVVWKDELSSPDGNWLASADTVQNGGFGGAEIHTTVFLKTRNSDAPAQSVFVIECDGPIPRAYTLDNVANRGGCVGLTMKWASPTHLDLSYEVRQGNDVIWQVAKVSRVEITVEPRPTR